MNSNDATKELLLMLENSWVGKLVKPLREDNTVIGETLSEIYKKAPNLSSGEQTIYYIALAVWNGNRTASVSDLMGLDRQRRTQVLNVLRDYMLGVSAGS